MKVETEKLIFQDMWRYLKEHNDPPGVGTDACAEFGLRAAEDIQQLMDGRWKNHPLAFEMGMAMYAYLEKKCKARGGGGA